MHDYSSMRTGHSSKEPFFKNGHKDIENIFGKNIVHRRVSVTKLFSLSIIGERMLETKSVGDNFEMLVTVLTIIF